MKRFGNCIKTVFVTTILVLFIAMPVMAISFTGLINGKGTVLPIDGEGTLLSIEGTTGITMQQFQGRSVTGSIGLVGTTLNVSKAVTSFRGVGVGSNTAGAANLINVGTCGCTAPVSGDGYFASSAYGTIGINEPNCCGNNSHGYVGHVEGTYYTKSVVNIKVN